MEQVRLNKYLAECGICSRRDADRLIFNGDVTVNGQNAVVGCRVSDDDEVAVNGIRAERRQKRVVLAFNKPSGVVCTKRDPHADTILDDLVDYPVRVTYAGRLDRDSEGLLLLTNDGDLIDAMMRGANFHEKEYLVRTHEKITPEFIDRIRGGVYLREPDVTTRPCKAEQTGKYTFRIILTQGLNRQIRRMCAALGNEAVKIRRVRIMNITLDEIPSGKYRELTEEEMSELYREAGIRF